MNPVFSIRDLTVNASSKTIVSEASLMLRSGEMVAMLGPSGSGKSVLARAIAEILPPTLTATYSDRTYTPVSYLPQDPTRALDPIRTVHWHLKHAAKSRGRLSKADAIRSLQAVGLHQSETFLNHYPHQLSGGMARRVTLAQALLANSTFIIVDEPTNGIDRESVPAMMQLLESKAFSGIGMLVITHDLTIATHYCSRGVLMDQGRCVEVLAGPKWRKGQFNSPLGKRLRNSAEKLGVWSA